MSNTVNNGIPFVPENTIDPAAGLNESLLTVDALLQLAVVSVGGNTPPSSPTNGARYIVGTAPTGAWAGRANRVAQWLDGGWRFYAARHALNTADGQVYVRQGATWGVAPAEWSADTVSQAEAEAGTATTRRAWTAQRVAQAVRAALLTGLSTASASVITATDSVLSALGKLQAQITGLATSKLDATANAVSASKLQTARTIALSGDVSGSADFDGSGDISINAQVADNSHTHSLANLGLGNAATATVQTSPTDTTAGRLMAVGAFGLGSRLVVTDADLAPTGLSILSLGTALNVPGGLSGVGWLETDAELSFTGSKIQRLQTTDTRRLFIRTVGITGWQELYHTGNQLSLGTTPATAQAALELVKGTSPGNVLVAGSELVGKHTVECFSFTGGGVITGVTIYTNIPADTIMPNLIIRGTLNGYTEPFEARLSWYFYDGAVYMPNVLITATGVVSGMRFYLRPENGKIVIRIDFGGPFYIPRLAFDALLPSNVLNPSPAELQGWSAVSSNVAGSGEVEAARARAYHSRNILGTVSQSGGVPTGAIIERGSNANGRFTKYADGTVVMDNSGNAITTNPVATVGAVTSVDANKLRYGFWF